MYRLERVWVSGSVRLFVRDSDLLVEVSANLSIRSRVVTDDRV